MIIVDGRALAQKILSSIKPADKAPVSIAAISVGDSPAIKSFVEMKKKLAASVGMKMEGYYFESDAGEEKIINTLKNLAEDKNIEGIIVELPLPSGYDENRILSAIPIEKDIDVLSPFSGLTPTLVPPAVRALAFLLDHYKLDLKGKTAAVFGQSILIGKPIAHWLQKRCGKVFEIDENTSDPEALCKLADIVISGVGKPNLIKGAMIKNGAVVVDFGFEKLRDKVMGDIEFESVAPRSSLITPVPGGMGPLVIAAFLKNAEELRLRN